MIRDIESHLGHKILRAHSCSPKTRDGYYLSWNGYYDEDDNYIECYDENILQFYKEVLAPFHPTIFIAHGEEDSWIELAEDGKCSLEDLLNYRINDKYKPIPVNKETPFTYDSDYGTDEEYSVLVFVERFDYKKRLLKIDSLIIIADSRRI